MSQPSPTALSWSRQPFAELVRLAWPIVVSLVSFSMMTLVDALFVGRLGAVALAAVGIGGMGAFSILCFSIGLFSGAKVKVSYLVGAGRHDGLAAMSGAFLRLGFLLGAASCFVVLGVASLLPWVSADAAVGSLAREYCSLRGAGALFILPAAALAQYRQALGDSRSAMKAALIANVAHVPLNAGLIFGFGLGTAGAALATVTSNVIELGVLLRVQKKHGFGGGQFDGRLLRRVFTTGFPTGLERWLDVAAFALLVGILARMGPEQVAAHQIALQFAHFSFLPQIALSDAVSVLVAQSVGACAPELVRRVTAHGLSLGFGFALLCSALFVGAPAFLFSLFTGDPAVRAAGVHVMYVAALLQLLTSVYGVLKGALRGIGKLRFVATVTVACAWLFTPPLAIAFGFGLDLGAAGGWLGLCVEVLVGIGILSWATRRHPAFRNESTQVHEAVPAVQSV